jgi:hypothetical protein
MDSSRVDVKKRNWRRRGRNMERSLGEAATENVKNTTLFSLKMIRKATDQARVSKKHSKRGK